MNSAVIDRPVPAAEEPSPLTPHDTCDAASSGVEQAYVRVQLKSGRILDFCNHHYTEHSLALDFAGAKVTDDQRDSLVQNKLQGESHG